MKKTLIAFFLFTAFLFIGCGYQPTRITVVNRLGSWNIEEIYISKADEDDWGLNSLRSNAVLAPGDSIAIAVEPGIYDIQLHDEDGDTYTRWDQQVAQEGYRWEVRLSELD
jgi:hypothetical protein